MNKNEAPEKIHIQPNAHDRWFEGKIPNGLPDGLFVEYTRTDAFIEKACKWLNKELPITDLSPSNNITFKVFDRECKKMFIEDFKKHMEV